MKKILVLLFMVYMTSMVLADDTSGPSHPNRLVDYTLDRFNKTPELVDTELDRFNKSPAIIDIELERMNNTTKLIDTELDRFNKTPY